MPRVAITGMGLVCAVGPTLDAAWSRLMAGEHGIGPIARFDASAYASRLAAEVPDAWLDAPDRRGTSAGEWRHGVRLFDRSVREAWRDAGIGPGAYPPSRIGVAAGATVNYLHLGRLREAWRHRDPSGTRLDIGRYLMGAAHPTEDFARRQGDLAAAGPARALGLSGPRIVVDTACSASAHAIVEAARAVRRGRADAMVAGGGCAIVMPLGILAFARIGALSTSRDPDEASRPFDRRRDGFVMGEAGAAIVLEDLDAARRRGARVYAELAGAGVTTTAASLTDPSADGGPEGRAMALALADGGIAPDAVDFVAAHGTSTPRNDVVETLAIKRALGARARMVAVASIKGALGHSLAAAGACNVVAAALAIARGEIPPTTGYRQPDPACDLDYVPGLGRRRSVGAALANAFAFGGHNVSIALRAVES